VFVMSVSVYLYLRSLKSTPTRPIFTKFVHVTCDNGSVVLRRRCDTLSTSGFVDDITRFRSMEPMGQNL